MKIIEFKYVGRGDRSWTEKVASSEEEGIDLDAIWRSAHEKGGLADCEMEIDFNEEKNRGTIYVETFRPVGSFRVLE